MTKVELRKIIKEKLKEFISDENLVGTERKAVCEKILKDKEYCSASVVLAYMALPDELNVLPVINRALLDGKKVAVPKINDLNQMDFYFLKKESDGVLGESFDTEGSFKNQVEKGYCGIFEPVGEGEKFENVGNEKIFVIVPGRAFSKNGVRLGRGKGFYDVFLDNLRKRNADFYTAGVCYSCQLLEEIPNDSNDFPIDMVFTI